MGLLDRDDLLARTDLAEIITEICGTPTGRGRSRRWHCANPDHPDTHPSMGVYTGRTGQRWKCHACGAGGTAIDLLMVTAAVSAGDAMHDLARRLGLDTPSPRSAPVRPVIAHEMRVSPTRATALAADPAIDDLVSAAEGFLQERVGGLARRKLGERGFSDAVLRANRVGFDPGPGLLPRPKGLPRSSPGIVYPILDPHSGRAIYYQLRTLSPSHATGRKYDQPVSDIAPNPKIAVIRTAQPPAIPLVAITEGIPDGLTAAEAGVTGIAVLGVGHAGVDTVDTLVSLILSTVPAAGYAVCFDPDQAGLGSGTRLADRLAHHGAAVARLLPPDDLRDLNAWWQADRRSVAQELTGTFSALAL